MNTLLFDVLKKFRALKEGESGQDLVEYALLVTLIALAVIGGVERVAQAINPMYTNISTVVVGTQGQSSGSGGGQPSGGGDSDQ